MTQVFTPGIFERWFDSYPGIVLTLSHHDRCRFRDRRSIAELLFYLPSVASETRALSALV